MINSKKKGFTIVELVIVIAVIAVLSAVLIPTFSNLVKKANMSADQMAVKQMNTALSVVSVEDNPDEFRELIDILDGNGYNVKSLTPLSKGYIFVWNKAENKIEMVEDTTATDDVTTFNLATGASYIDEEVKSSQDLIQALSAGSDVTLANDISLNASITISGDVTINLNGYKLDGNNMASQRIFNVLDGTKLVINAQGSDIICGGMGFIDLPTGNNGTINATIIINGGNFVCEEAIAGQRNWGAFLRIRNNAENVDITLNDVVFTGKDAETWIISSGDFDGKMNLKINGCTLEGGIGVQVLGDSNVEIVDSKITAREGFGIQIHEGKAQISGTEIKAGKETNGSAPATCVAASGNGEVMLSNCTLISNDTPYALYVYNSGGLIDAKNITFNGFTESNRAKADKTNTEISSIIKLDGMIIAQDQ